MAAPPACHLLIADLRTSTSIRESQTLNISHPYNGILALALHQNIMADITVSVQAYCKMMLHAAKYPHCAVNGVLLAEKSKSKDNRSLTFVDCIPLFHLSLGLAPMLEVALTQVSSHHHSHSHSHNIHKLHNPKA